VRQGSTSDRRQVASSSALVLVPLLALLVPACGDGSPTREGPAAAPSVCAWAVRADSETLNIAYPDTAATYWAMSYDLAPGEMLEIEGTFSAARYASFASYGPFGGAIDVLTDRDIQPDRGSTNPFSTARGRHDGADGTARSGRYTVVVSAEETHEDRPNMIGARPNRDTAPLPTNSGLVTTSTSGPGADQVPDEANRRGSGLEADASGGPASDVVSGTVLYRVYLPDDPGDRTGGAGLPDVTVVAPDGERHPVPTCDSPGPSARSLELVENHERPTRPAPPEPIFARPAVSEANLFPNPDNTYIGAIASYRRGRIVVVEGTAPTVPAPTSGRPIGSGEQLRYWSLCTNEYRKPYPVTACAADRDVVLDDDGRYTFVISTRQDRPANATAADGITWLDWGSTEVDNLLLLRHMLADPGFAEAATNVAPGTLAASTMGRYAPEAVYCRATTFEQGGAAACRQGTRP
jgi:hypothetical protein